MNIAAGICFNDGRKMFINIVDTGRESISKLGDSMIDQQTGRTLTLIDQGKVFLVIHSLMKY